MSSTVRTMNVDWFEEADLAIEPGQKFDDLGHWM